LAANAAVNSDIDEELVNNGIVVESDSINVEIDVDVELKGIAVESDSINVEIDVDEEFNGIAVESDSIRVDVELLLDNNTAILADNEDIVELILIMLDAKLIAVDSTTVIVVDPLMSAVIKSEVTIDSIRVDCETILVDNTISEDSKLVVVDTADISATKSACRAPKVAVTIDTDDELVSNGIVVESDSLSVERDIEVELNGIAVESDSIKVEFELLLDNNIAALGDNADVVELRLVTLAAKLIPVKSTAVFVVNTLTLANIRSVVMIDSISVDCETMLADNIITVDNELVVVDITDTFEARFA
jgi:hypothetical protein